MFKNRKSEIKLLKRLYRKKEPKLIILYGKRRVGKTELLKEFSKKHKVLYLLARQESEKDQLSKISRDTAEFFNDNLLKSNPFQSYDAFFTYINEKQTPVIFDEFPFLVQSKKALPSILQDYWDNKFSKKNTFLILCGSSITMMESLLGYKSPLYGRRTEQILLEPLKFKDACLFFGGIEDEEKVIIYSILGGTPAYLLEFDYKNSIEQNIKNKILSKNTFLSQDVLFVLREELNEPRNYFSIIKSIAHGNNKLGEIVSDTGLEKGLVIKYISVLIDLQIIERLVPITEKSKEKSRKGVYVLKDNYFKFWFKFIFENNNYIEQGKQDILFKQIIKPQINSFVGKSFEEIALNFIKEKEKEYIIGRWWEKEEEIDFIGINKEQKKLIIGEVKWKNLNKTEINTIINNLKRKRECINKFKEYSERYIIISKSSQKVKIERLEIYELKDILKNSPP